MPSSASSAAADALSRAAIARMESTLPWYSALPAQQRAWVGLVAQAGVRSFMAWLEDPSLAPTVTTDVFGAAPRELTRSVSLRQTLDLVRTVVTVIEDNSPTLAEDPHDSDQVAQVQVAVLKYSREVAFSAAHIYAQAAELRAAWDTRLEVLVVDALLREDADNALQSRFSTLGWRRHRHFAVIAGHADSLAGSVLSSAEALRTALRGDSDDALVGIHGESLVAIVGTEGEMWDIAVRVCGCFGPGPVVVGTTVAELSAVKESATAALSGLVAARGVTEIPRPVHADDLLPERALLADAGATGRLIEQVHDALGSAGPGLRETVTMYLESGGSLEATARNLFVHPNTVRYRLRRVAELTGWDATRSRDAFVLNVGLTLGRLHR